ncbi:4Fe-4S dicluster domain-containing protein [Candidatus Omnitrophota bacterium]
MPTTFYINRQQFAELVSWLKESYRVFAPVLRQENPAGEKDYSYKKLAEDDSIIFNPYRATEPLKNFFTLPKEEVSEYFDVKEKGVVDLDKTIIFGLKNCDLAAHKIQDFVFLEGVEEDTFYRARRENTILVSGDCTGFREVCHCLAWDIKPSPVEDFDLNLTPLNDGYLVEVGSERGSELLKKHEEYFVPARGAQISARREKREKFLERLKQHIDAQGLVSKNSVQRLVRQGYSLDTWEKFMADCVECGGCNMICDTCHCFLLVDESQDKKNGRFKVWDSCQYANFARVAGGANPLKSRTQRLRNRFLKKFDFFIDNLGLPACCGCGRCIEVCPGKIDIREVLKDLENKLRISG